MVLNNILETITKIFFGILRLPRRVVLFLLKFYRVNFSPDHSHHGRAKYPFGYCRYSPTCSEYASEAIEKYGVIWGGIKALWRVLRCNPWSKGGHDPVD